MPKMGSYDGQIFGNHVVDVPRLGIYVDSYNLHSYNIQVFQNLVHDVRGNGIWLAAEQGGLLENIQVYNNVVYGNKNYGIGLHDCCEGSPTHPMKDITIINNTIYNNGWVTGGGIIVRNPDVQNIVIRNNIVSQNLEYQIRVRDGVPLEELHIDHNLIYGPHAWDGEQDGTDVVFADPVFVDAVFRKFPSPGHFACQRCRLDHRCTLLLILTAIPVTFCLISEPLSSRSWIVNPVVPPFILEKLPVILSK